MEQRATFFTLGVENLEKSAEFYEEVFGWTRSELSNQNIFFYRLHGSFLALFDKVALAEDATVSAEGNGFKSFTLAYNTRSEKEVDEVIAGLREKGVKIVKPPQKVFWGGYSAYIADPDDNLWEIAFNPFLPDELI